MGWIFGRKRRPLPATPLERIVRPAERSAVERQWWLRFEETQRLALADLADALADLRACRDSQQRVLHLAHTRDALDRVARASGDADVAQACGLFGQILAAPRQRLSLRLDAAALALETLTFLVVAESGERRARAADALRQLSDAARRAEAA